MKILLSSHTLFGFPLEETFLTAREANLDGVELLVGLNRASRDEKEIKRLIKKYGLPVVALHQPVWHWPHTSRRMLARLAQFAVRIGAETVVAHLSVLRLHPKKRIFDFVRSLEEIHGVTFAFENGQRGTIEQPPRWAWQAGDLARLIDEHRFQLTFDLPKFVISNGPSSGLGAGREREFCFRYARAFANIHLHGSQEGRIHRPLAESDEDYLSLLADFYPRTPEASVTLEVFPLYWLSVMNLGRDEIRRKIASIIGRDVELVRRAPILEARARSAPLRVSGRALGRR